MGEDLGEFDRCSTQIVHIVYGLPSVDTMQRALLGQVALGGCFVRGNDPSSSCWECGRQFGRSRRPRQAAPPDDAPGLA